MLSLLLLSCAAPPPALAAPPSCLGGGVSVGAAYTGTIEHPHIPLTGIGVGYACDLVSPRPWLLAWLAADAAACDAGPAAALPMPAVTPLVICLEIDGATEPPGPWTAPVLLVVSPNTKASVTVADWP